MRTEDRAAIRDGPYATMIRARAFRDSLTHRAAAFDVRRAVMILRHERLCAASQTGWRISEGRGGGFLFVMDDGSR